MYASGLVFFWQNFAPPPLPKPAEQQTPTQDLEKNTCLFGYSPVIRPPVAPLRKPPAKKKLFAHAKPTPRYRYTGNKIGEYKHLSFRKRRRSPPGTFESDCLFFGRPGMRRGGGRPPAFPQYYWLVCVAVMLGKKRVRLLFLPSLCPGAEQGGAGRNRRSWALVSRKLH